MIKDHLSSSERDEVILISKMIDKIDIIVSKPQDSKYKTKKVSDKNYTKDELKNLRTAKTLMFKAIESLYLRLNDTALRTLSKASKDTGVLLTNKFAINQYTKRIESDIAAGYENNKDYFDLVEVALDTACRDCTKCANDCSLYKYMEEHYIADLDFKINNCKYAYPEFKK
ncbi:MAG: DUF5651 domain-containing protein [Bacillota bacterium]|nr:DUF5651 domain-containing protein [Bacillota bacterium]